ncbi:MAG: hypothetical protein ACI8RA_003147 [Chlamydiales bacterium]|jgi:hypothetical protein
MEKSIKVTVAILILAIISSGVERYYIHYPLGGWTFYTPYELGEVSEANKKFKPVLFSIIAINLWALFGLSVIYNLNKLSKKKER